MRATRRSVTVERGDTRILVESETVRHTLLDYLFGHREPAEQIVLNGPWWALETRTRYGHQYERLREATRAELIIYAHLNINPNTAAWARSTMIDPAIIGRAMTEPSPVSVVPPARRPITPTLASLRELPR